MPYIEDIQQLELENTFDIEISADKTIWRYVSFEKFLSLVNSRAIHFRQAELLSDEYEGEIPPREVIPHPGLAELYDANSLITHISSWYIGDSESQEMWDEYEEADLLIKSDYQSFRDSISIDDEFGVQFVEVDYIDWTDEELGLVSEQDGTLSGGLLDPFKYKREKFAFESEFRAIATTIGTLSDMEENKGEVDFGEMVDKYREPNIFVRSELDTLIDEIRVSPELGGWVVEEVSEWMDREFGIGNQVRHSNLAD
ncbi:hypothetical protein [Haloplanus aerogenes]|uniref:Uncharacterized protein n=1 Tax=Haloplanus aerogenes TaxID=660522 RepID=A0A3M0EBX3_9EURY|nr:hypothetical protein [Haloplanus aerogenes]AZH25670.1 hypothetical protein DU502_09890 [Haloplanus aerogenes]RMB25400.1 hypothetical protein ATH50_0489 [Haloplanus aerogenes]